MGLRDRARLVAEILIAYLPLVRDLRANDLAAMVALARAPVPARLPGPSPEAERALAVRLGKMVLRTLSVLPTDRRCLIRSLVLLRLLDQRSIEASLVIGVQDLDGFSAHAWVEHRARPVLPSNGFHRLLEL